MTCSMHSRMRSARIASYKSKKIADRSRRCAFPGSGADDVAFDARGTRARRRRAGGRDSEWSLTCGSGERKNQADACRNIGACLTTADRNGERRFRRIGENHPIQRGIISPKKNRRPESVSNPDRRSSATAGRAAHRYRCAAAPPCIMPMLTFPAPSPASRVRCPDRRRADRRAALPTSQPRPPRSSCRPRWWPSAPCRGTCRRP